jgi:hypothetical protein
MVNIRNFTAAFLMLFTCSFQAQLKFIVEDFEGFSDGIFSFNENGIFTFGCLNAKVDGAMCNGKSYSGQKAIRLEKSGKADFGGFGKGLNRCIELDQRTDYFNFYVYSSGDPVTFRIELQDDDNNDNKFNKHQDDNWTCNETIKKNNGWQLISIPLTRFSDANKEGDGAFNISYHHGKLLTVLFTLSEPEKFKENESWLFDFFCFSQGKLPTGPSPFDAPFNNNEDFCALGAWTEDGNWANYKNIGSSFENNFIHLNGKVEKKLGVVHFFQPFSTEKDNTKYHFPSVERINQVIAAGYIPMITLEDHFVKTKPGEKQPNLYSIVDGHFDSFFGFWAHQIKLVNGVVLLRILHEFNGDWYPWCTAKNDMDPVMPAKAFRYIHNIFVQNGVNNVRFIWCPNSMSVPQESWNNIMDAYPGDDYVDFVALDIYNGAGVGAGVDIWRSFRKEGIENYFVLTQKLASKPLFICETASRERKNHEQGQSKAEWIKQMSEALKTDMSKVRLLTWFNEKESFKVNSSTETLESYNRWILNEKYFVHGKEQLFKITQK